MQRLQARVAHSNQLLAALSYRSVLSRGFALVRDDAGHAIHARSDRTGGTADWNSPTTRRCDRGCGIGGGDKTCEPLRASPKPAARSALRSGRSGKFVLARALFTLLEGLEGEVVSHRAKQDARRVG